MTQEEMRQAWADTDARLRRIETQLGIEAVTLDAATVARRRTALDNLARRYRRFSILGLVMAVVSIFYIFGDILPGDKGRWVWLGFVAYFATVSVMDNWLYRGISSIDVAAMPVEEVTRLTLRYRRWHRIFIAILLPLAAALLTLMLAAAGFEPYFTLGAVAGLIVGLAIGLRQLLAFLADYRSMLN